MSIALLVSVPVLASAAAAGSSSSAAAQLPGEVANFRTSMTMQLDSYFKEYGNRLSAAERQEMNSLRAQVDRELAAAQAAARTFDATYHHAITGLERVQPILQPKLSLFEAFSAKSDLDGQLSRFEELGNHVHHLAGC